MLPSFPIWITILFALITLATMMWFAIAMKSRGVLLGVMGWAILQTAMGLSGFYTDTFSIPPRVFAFGVLPTLIFIVGCSFTKGGRALMDGADLHTLTWMHTIRVPVEFVLYCVVGLGLLSEYMSVHGTNFDVLSGLTAPIIAYFAFRDGTVNKRLLLIWNVLALFLLLNVVITAAFCIPSPIQKLAFDQPNIAVLHFPMNLLPTVVVPLVLFAHVIAIRRLVKS
ncbi:MAG: hypothetical protein WAR83_03175 [Flavobacteriales bacterium]